MNVREYYFPIGVKISTPPNDVNLVTIVKLVNGFVGGGVIFGAVENAGADNFVLSVQQSDDNAQSDAYAALASANLRYGGAGVSSITVVPGALAEFSIEWSAAVFSTARYLKFLATTSPTGKQLGLLGLFSLSVQLDERLTAGVP